LSLTRDWWLPRLTARTALLVPASWLFRIAVAVRTWLYRFGAFGATRLQVPVIIVGNLTVGGSGKTPLVIALVHRLRDAGHRPGVISRGYRRESEGHRRAQPVHVLPDGDPALAGDEPLLIASATRVPVVVDADRVRAGRALLAAHPEVDVIVSDDGLQHYALARDIEIAVFDDRGAGNRQMLPAGPLREPLSHGTGLTALVHNASAADASRNRLYQRFPAMHLMRLEPQRCYRLMHPVQTCCLAELVQASIAAIAGIGNPERFFATLRSAGIQATPFAFPDHHAFTHDDLAQINADVLIMTEKDALKCVTFNDGRIWVLPVTAKLDTAFFDLILERLRGRKAA
jgi:tetraacyldisaccharide 4'-kinase